MNLKAFRPACRLLAGLLLAGATASCSSGTAPTLTRWEADLLPVFPATVAGRAAAVTQFGRTQVSIQISEAEPEVTYGWRVDSGSCQAQGEMLGGQATYPPLTPGAGGTATANAVLSEVFRSRDAFAVRAFLEETGDVVACGELQLIG